MTEYGKDTSCTRGMRTGRLVTGVELVAEAIYRRLTTPRGTLRGGEEEANYGLDLASLVGSGTSPSAAAAMPGKIENECKKDERIESVTATVTSVVSGPATTWTIAIEAVTAAGPFALQIASNGVTSKLLGITT